MRHEATIHRLNAQLDAQHDRATFRKFLEEQGFEADEHLAHLLMPYVPPFFWRNEWPAWGRGPHHTFGWVDEPPESF
jgi:hypothetical protein